MAEKILVTNRRARRDYTVLHTLEAGVALKGSEVKSLRQGRGNLAGSYGMVKGGEAWLHDFHITPYDHGSVFNPPAKRVRKLLLHKREIKRLIGQTSIKGNTLIPLKIYLKSGVVKVELAVAKGKKLFDRREELKRRQADREIDRSLRSRR